MRWCNWLINARDAIMSTLPWWWWCSKGGKGGKECRVCFSRGEKGKVKGRRYWKRAGSWGIGGMYVVILSSSVQYLVEVPVVEKVV